MRGQPWRSGETLKGIRWPALGEHFLTVEGVRRIHGEQRPPSLESVLSLCCLVFKNSRPGWSSKITPRTKRFRDIRDSNTKVTKDCTGAGWGC